MGVNEIVQIGTRLKRARKSKGISQRAMADQLGLTYSTYSNYENGHREPNRDVIERACAILEIDVDSLIYDYLSPEEYAIHEKAMEPYSVDFSFGSIGHEIVQSLSELNQQGREKVVEYAKDLTHVPEYRHSAPSLFKK